MSTARWQCKLIHIFWIVTLPVMFFSLRVALDPVEAATAGEPSTPRAKAASTDVKRGRRVVRGARIMCSRERCGRWRRRPGR